MSTVALWFIGCAAAIYALAPYVRRMDARAEQRRRRHDRDAWIGQLAAMTAEECRAAAEWKRHRATALYLGMDPDDRSTE